MSYKNAILTPAYGRDYTSAEAIIKDWNDGRDFIMQSECFYCSIRDTEAFMLDGYTHIHFRYQKMTKVHVLAL